MITELRIRGIGVIDEAVIEFDRGLTVVTGETGAGKTMVLTGLGLLRGTKADSSMVRAGASSANVDGVWRIDAPVAEGLAGMLDETGIELEAGAADPEPAPELLLSRSVGAEGRSRAFAGGRVVPAATLSQLTDLLIAVHGQADQIQLVDPRRQRAILDRFGGLSDAREAFRAAHREWREAVQRHDELLSARQELDRQAALLRLGLADIDEVAPVANEDEELKAQAAVLAHSSELAEQVARAHDLLSEQSDSALDLVSAAQRELERAAGLDAGLEALSVQLSTAAEALQAVSVELASYAASAEADPGRLEAIEERRQQINQLKRKYGPTLAEVLQWYQDSAAEVARADGADDELNRLAATIPALRARVITDAAALSQGRQKAAKALATAVSGELQALAMADAKLTIDITTADAPEEFGSDGADTVEFLLTAHAGAAPRPIGQGASGGELSRIMLAVEVCLAGQSATPTFVFDEIDAGIGGRVAVEVGTRLSRLAQQAQVIVVTHLPQVAAFADRHVVVQKATNGSVTSASVATVEGEERVAELVRMLSGLEGSASGAEHAAELLQVAQQARQSHATPKRSKRGR